MAANYIQLPGTVINFQILNLSTAQREALNPPAGTLVYDTTLNRYFYYDGSAWIMLATSVTGMTDYAPTLSDATNTTVVAKYKRVNYNFILIEAVITWSGAGAGGALTMSLPAGHTIDTSQLSGGTSTANNNASLLSLDATWFISGSGWKKVDAIYATNTTISFNDNTGALLGTTFASGDGLKMRLMIPIVEYV